MRPCPNPQFDESLVSFEDRRSHSSTRSLVDMSAELGHGKSGVEKHEQTGIYVDRAIDFIKRNEDAVHLHLWLNDVTTPSTRKIISKSKFMTVPSCEEYAALSTWMTNWVV